MDEIKSEYPLHWQIWNGNVEELQQQLQAEQVCGWVALCLPGGVGVVAPRNKAQLCVRVCDVCECALPYLLIELAPL